MKLDIFFSICQAEVHGWMPSERTMFENFFDQVCLADELGFGVAWVAETHLSCEIQKTLPEAVIPGFKGEIGLNTDIFQLAHKIFSVTQNIEVGSAIRNILCNGGPIAHAESLRTFLSLNNLNLSTKIKTPLFSRRKINLGFAAGRFEFSNRPYGIIPRNPVEKLAWPVVKGKIFQQATEIFLRLLRGDSLSSTDLAPMILSPHDFRNPEDWEQICKNQSHLQDQIHIPNYWNFEKLGLIPRDVSLEFLKLIIGTHDPQTQILANQYAPVGVFNLSITPQKVIEDTHARMQQFYHPQGGPWRREYMPRTVMVFIDATKGLSQDAQQAQAQARAQEAWENYWLAMEGTLDHEKVEQAVHNALVGSPKDIVEQIQRRYHPEDRLMLWFDFNCHDNDWIQQSMRWFMEHVQPEIKDSLWTS